MSEHPYILCPVRGGPESRDTVTKAIDLALEKDARLVFFHIVDAEFLGSSGFRQPIKVIYSELKEMSQFVMLVLKDRAERRGVKQVDIVIREGNVRKQLQRAAVETHASVIVMGKPVRSPGSNNFKLKEFEGFVEELEKMGDIRIMMVEPVG
jgi:nucleotide-binding universal stress UspA family protein